LERVKTKPAVPTVDRTSGIMPIGTANANATGAMHVGSENGTTNIRIGTL